MSRRSARTSSLVVCLAALFVLVGCRFANGLRAGESPGLGAFNDSDIPIELMLNGQSLGTLESSTGMVIASTWRMPALPWEVEARTESGRVLLTMTVTPEDLARTGVKGAGVDLPGGRFGMWAGATPP